MLTAHNYFTQPQINHYCYETHEVVSVQKPEILPKREYELHVGKHDDVLFLHDNKSCSAKY